MAPPNNSNFSVKVVLPASGCEMMAKVRLRPTSADNWSDKIGDPSVVHWKKFAYGDFFETLHSLPAAARPAQKSVVLRPAQPAPTGSSGSLACASPRACVDGDRVAQASIPRHPPCRQRPDSSRDASQPD